MTRLVLICDAFLSLMAAVAAYSVYAELFVPVPRVRIPRIQPGTPMIWNVPTTTSVIEFVAALVCAAASIALVLRTHRDPSRVGRALRVLQITALCACVLAWVAAAYDFFANAGRFG